MTLDTERLVVEVAERSRSKEGRPRMPEDVEKRLEDSERRSTRAYASMEYTAHRLEKLAELMADDEDEAVPEPWGDSDFQDSLVHHLEDTLQKISASEEKK